MRKSVCCASFINVPKLIPIALFSLLLLVASHAREVSGTVADSDFEQLTIDLTLESGETLSALKVGPGDAAIDYKGRRIQGMLETSSGEDRLTNIWPDNPITNNAMAGVNRSLIREAALLGRGESLGRGDYLPDFAFYNQRGEPVFSSHLRTIPTVMTFIFTRCGDPSMCPATATRLRDLGRKATAEGWEDARFVAVSFDPEYDTPGILRQYAEAVGLDGPSFELLTGDEETVQALLRIVGVRTINEQGTIVHNLVTLLSDDHGRIVLRQDGSRWSASAILERLQEMEK